MKEAYFTKTFAGKVAELCPHCNKVYEVGTLGDFGYDIVKIVCHKCNNQFAGLLKSHKPFPIIGSP